MIIKITNQADGSKLVNGKEVICDIDGKWICHEPMSEQEIKAFKDHLKITEGQS